MYTSSNFYSQQLLESSAENSYSSVPNFIPANVRVKKQTGDG